MVFIAAEKLLWQCNVRDDTFRRLPVRRLRLYIPAGRGTRRKSLTHRFGRCIPLRAGLGDSECAVRSKGATAQLPLESVLQIPRAAGKRLLRRVIIAGFIEPPRGRQGDRRHIRTRCEWHPRHAGYAKAELVAPRRTGRRHHQRPLVHQSQLRLVSKLSYDGPHANLFGFEAVMLGDGFELELLVQMIPRVQLAVDHFLDAHLHLVVVDPSGSRRLLVLVERIIVRNFQAVEAGPDLEVSAAFFLDDSDRRHVSYCLVLAQGVS